uniref:Secreted protein n=1 Tax=Trichogramma kaykai TaxID=54128 RepID=A0ABD2X744_9HYME
MGVAPVGVAGQSCSATCAVHWPKDHPWPAWCALSWRLKKCTYGTCRALDSRETISVHGAVRNHKSSLLTGRLFFNPHL